MTPDRQVAKEVSREYDAFLEVTSALSSHYGESNNHKYLLTYRARISSQIAIQLQIIEEQGLGRGKMLSLGGWPGITLFILNRLTGIKGTLIDHPALLTGAMATFYKEQGLETVAFDFADAATEPLPVSGTFEMIECCQCIEHWNFSPIPIFRQVFSELLSPAGSLLVTVPNAASLYRRLAALVGRNPYPSMQSLIDTDKGKPGAEVSPHWREYTQEDLQMLVKHCGGTLAAVLTASYPTATHTTLAHRIYSLLYNLHPRLKENLEAVCTRA
jgi:SAM-dependent methyltransferase